MRNNSASPSCEYLERESHYLWGDRFLLHLIETNGAPFIHLGHTELTLALRKGASDERRKEVMEEWYRKELRATALPLIAKWEGILGVHAELVFIQRMKTRWGSCNPHKANIRLNTELAKKSPVCLEYVVVHELVHLIEPSHKARFVALMDRYLPNWKQLREGLNHEPLGHVEWEY